MAEMAALRQSPTAVLPKSSPQRTAPISSSLRPLPSATRLRPAPLRLAFSRSAAPAARPRRGSAGTVMMDTAAASYATALADVAKSNGTLEVTLADLEKVDRVLCEPSAQSFFANPTIPVEKKQEVIGEMARSSELQPHTANFLNIVIDMKRMELLKDIIKEFEACYNTITGTEVAVVSSVVRLESQHLAQIAKTVQRLTGAKNVRIKTEIDPSLIAGFTIRYGNSGSKLIDMSVKKQLDEIAAQLDFSSISLV